MADAIFQFVGQMVVAGGGGAVVALLLFQWLGKTWIENKFAERLEQLKHDQNVVVARLRVEIESMLSGALKFQEREFEVLPGVWDKLDAAFANVSWLVSPLQMNVDVRRMNDVQLEEQLASEEWSESQKQEVRDAHRSDRDKVYSDIQFWYKLNRVKRAFGDFQKYNASNAIFFPLELKEKLKAIEKILWSAITAMQVGKEAEDFKLQNQGWAKVSEEAEVLRSEIELDIRVRLESHMRAAKEKASA